MKRVSKAEWLEASLDILEREGIEGLRIERIAKQLNISRSGFYWHFKNREDLRSQIIQHWADEFTEVVASSSSASKGPPKKRLDNIANMILRHHLTRYDFAITSWARTDKAIASQVNRVYRKRFNFIESIFAELGFKGDDLAMRTQLFVCYHSWEKTTFPGASKKSLQSLIRKRVDLLTKP